MKRILTVFAFLETFAAIGFLSMWDEVLPWQVNGAPAGKLMLITSCVWLAILFVFVMTVLWFASHGRNAKSALTN